MVRYVGAPIAAVAAKDRKTALAAIAAIRSSSERLPSVIGLDAARKPDAPVVFEKSTRKKAGNVSEGGGGAGALERQCPRAVGGVLAEGEEGAELDRRRARGSNNPLLVEATFRTGTQSHACLEPHAAVARFDGDRLTVHVSTQAVFHLMELIAKRYKLEHDKVRVIADHVGGGFGSKASLGIETIAAIELAREAKAPVRVAFDRHEELSVTGYRPAAELKIALLPSEQGELKALSLTAHADTGAATNSTHRSARAADLSGGSQGTRRFRRHQQPAARRAVPRPRRAADGVRAGTGDRRSRAADEGRSDRACANAGIPIPTGSGCMTGRSGSTSGATGRRRQRRPAAIAAASASPPDTGSISGSPARRSKSRSRADASSPAPRRRTSATAAAP